MDFQAEMVWESEDPWDHLGPRVIQELEQDLELVWGDHQGHLVLLDHQGMEEQELQDLW